MNQCKPAHSGNKYHRTIHSCLDGCNRTLTVDVYDVLAAFNVTSQSRGHAIKKLLCAGMRGKGDETQDLAEAIDAIRRDVEISSQGKEKQ